jgi:putative oxidoreductase
MKCAPLYKSYHWAVSILESIGTWFPPLVLRLILAWEFGEAGFEKLHGENWFANITLTLPWQAPSFLYN